VITTVAGTGSASPGDGRKAVEASLLDPRMARQGPDGAVYVADAGDNRIRRIGPDGSMSTWAGTGVAGDGGDGGKATDAELGYPTGIAFGQDDTLYVADANNNRIRAVGRDRVITTVAGSGSAGDGGPAEEAELTDPQCVEVAADGSLYVAERSGNRIRRIDANGTISIGAADFSGDGGPATSAQLDGPTGVHVGADGSLYISDYRNSRLRKVDTAGTITTYAGNGTKGYTGDGGPAVNAQLSGPFTVTTDADGTVYIADDDAHTIRKVDPSGVIIGAGVTDGRRQLGQDLRQRRVVARGDGEDGRVRASAGGSGWRRFASEHPSPRREGDPYGLTFPVFAHYGVQLWVPEVGGAIDPESEAHDLVMSVFGGMSKGERSRIKIRVRAAMASQAQIEGRYLGGRPPYGYILADTGPHPNPAKAAEGKRLHRLAPDPVCAEVVRRIFAEYLSGRGRYAIAEGLTRDGIPCPSMNDPDRNPHRNNSAWAKSAVAAILLNPRYTGYEVWNKQRKDEVLIDVDDVALGHETKLRWNNPEDWIWSTDLAHEPIIDLETFTRAQQLRTAGGRGHTRERTKTRHPYVLKSLILCGLCDRRMQGQRNNGAAYYRCRYPNEYGLANRTEHPRNVYLREQDLLSPLDDWLNTAFAPHRLIETLRALYDTQPDTDPAVTAAERMIKACDQKLLQHRRALEAGADPELVAGWMREVQAQRAEAVNQTRVTKSERRLTQREIESLITSLGDTRKVLANADPEDKADLYKKLQLRLTYHPGQHTVRAEVKVDPQIWGYGLCPRPELPHNPMPIMLSTSLELP